MFFSLVLLALIASGGFALTYLVSDDEPFMWRVAAGSIVGSAVYSVLVFVAACAFGFSPAVIYGSLVVSMLPLILLRRPVYAKKLSQDLARAKGKLTGVTGRKAVSLAYYLIFFVTFYYFFMRACYFGSEGVSTGASQNLGDLAFHLGAIFGFTEAPSFPPQNPSWAGAKFSYPFMCDLLSACMVKVGIDFKDAMHAQNFTWAFALFIILERFVYRLTNNRLAGKIAPAILFLSGGIGFIWFFKDFSESGKALFEFITHLPRDYTIGDDFRWGNPMIVLFITQRGFLLGMPLTILVLQYFWKIFTRDDDAAVQMPDLKNFGKLVRDPDIYKPFFVGLLAGTLPLVHLHSLVTLFIVTVFLMAMRPNKWLQWVVFGIGVAIIAVPELAWSIKDSATDSSKFYGWHFGWDKRDNSFLWFWFKNTGITIPAILAGLYLFWTRAKPPVEDEEAVEGETPPKKPAKRKKQHQKAEPVMTADWARHLLMFYIPFAFLFLLTNVAKLAPWEWDNIKIMIYWFIVSTAFIGYVLAWAWQRTRGWQIAAVGCFIGLTLAGSIDVWRVANGQMNNGVFSKDSVAVAEQIKQKTAPGAMFLNAPTFNSTVVLTGRQSLMRYPGHLGSYGIDYGPREADVKTMYQGGPNAEALFQKYNIDYVMMTPEEKRLTPPNEDYFKKYQVIAEAGQYKVYKIKN